MANVPIPRPISVEDPEARNYVVVGREDHQYFGATAQHSINAEEITDDDVQAISEHLTKHPVATVRKCLFPPAESSGDLQTDSTPSADTYHSLLKAWRDHNEEGSWRDLSSCLSKLRDPSLMEWMKQHLSSKTRGTGVVVAGPERRGSVPQSRSVLDHFTDPGDPPNVDPHSTEEEHREFPPTLCVQEECPSHYELLCSGQESSRCPSDLKLTDPSVEQAMQQLEETGFSNLQDSILKALDDKSVPVSEVKVYLSRLCTDEQETIYYFENKMLGLNNCTTHKEVFEFLASKLRLLTFLNYNILESINSEFHLEADALIASYADKVLHFMEETKLADYLILWNRVHGAHSTPGYEPVIVKVRAKWSSYTLARVAEVENYLAGEFKVKKLIFHLDKGTFGCVYLMWMVPSAVAKYMQQMIQRPEWPKKLQCGIEELRIGRQECVRSKVSKPGITMSKHDVYVEESMKKQSPVSEPESLDREDELFILYTSGTGKGSPTAVMHTQAGFLLYVAAVPKFMFNCQQPGDVFGKNTVWKKSTPSLQESSTAPVMQDTSLGTCTSFGSNLVDQSVIYPS